MILPSSETHRIIQCIESLQPGEGEVIMLLFAEQSAPDIPALIEALNNRQITFFGGIFPGLLYGNKAIKTGGIIKKFKAAVAPFCVSDISSGQLSGFPHFETIAHVKTGTAIVLLDGLTPNIYRFLEPLNDLLGEKCQFIGGGAGSMSLQQRPCVFNNDGFKADAAVVCVVNKQVHLGVRHGWEQMAGPLVATQTEGNTIIQLNWQPAIEVYNKIVENDCGIKLDHDNFAGIAQGYPFGILREKEDDIVRDPLSISNNGAIVCIGEVPPNTVLHVLIGTPDALLNAARKAMDDCGKNAGFPIAVEGTFVVDCITRTLFLDQQFTEELNIVRENLVIKTPEQEPYGILSLGEISSYGDGLLELFNKTIVIGAFY
ncbi:MAG: FIST C-terminal domain-containing protein [Saprospiraceae bacterium]|nr:FIST C-terminal domain-containing protein [Saprospiraceae bacterium]